MKRKGGREGERESVREIVSNWTFWARHGKADLQDPSPSRG